MRTITTNVYEFHELSHEAKEKALEKYWDINVDHDWWESVYEDARNVGIEIKGFDLDRGSYCNIKLLEPAETVINLIIKNHGRLCDTKARAEVYKNEMEKIDEELEDDNEYDSEIEALFKEFKHDISEEYRRILQKEYDYLTGREAITETIEANQYEFTIDGRPA